MEKVSVPATLGEAIDQMHAIVKAREEKQAKFDKEIASDKLIESELEQHILLLLQKMKLSGSRGKTAQVSVKPKTVPHVNDWLAVFKWISENDQFSLVQKRLATTAWKEMVEDGVVIPGITSETFSTLSVTKI
jgi:chromatin segregation and condensation protein Rec8/ScpA/Scc1 (kleisin family)